MKLWRYFQDGENDSEGSEDHDEDDDDDEDDDGDDDMSEPFSDSEGSSSDEDVEVCLDTWSCLESLFAETISVKEVLPHKVCLFPLACATPLPKPHNYQGAWNGRLLLYYVYSHTKGLIRLFTTTE